MATHYSIPDGLFEQGKTICRWCREMFDLGRNRNGHVRQFCSRICAQRWHSFSKHGPRFQLKQCQQCNVEFRADVAKTKRTFCSRTCVMRSYYDKRVAKFPLRAKGKEYNCKLCGQMFKKSWWKQIFCSKTCSRFVSNDKQKTEAAKLRAVPRACPWCKKLFQQKQTGCQLFCSSRCKGNASSQRRRARMAGVEYRDWPSARKLIKRDGPECKLCGVE